MIDDHLVLAGGGHTHALILLRWAMKPQLRPSGLITLINRSSTTIYSGMLPGFVANKYSIDDISIDLRTLSLRAGVVFIRSEVIGIDVSNKSLFLKGRPSIDFSILSIDIGSETNLQRKNFSDQENDLICPVKPFEKSLIWISKQDEISKSNPSSPFAIIGSGLAALEIAFALRKRWPNRYLELHAKYQYLPKNIKKYLQYAQIYLKDKQQSIKYPSLICTGSKAPFLLKESGFIVDKKGRVLTSRTLQVIDNPQIFASGDCGVIDGEYRPPSGVWAVRASKPLARNLEKLSKGIILGEWKPQKRAIQLLSVDFDGIKPLAFCYWGNLILGSGLLISIWKDYIDRGFINKFKFTAKMNINDLQEKEINGCRGCAAKIPERILKYALKKSDLGGLWQEPEDANQIAFLNNDQTLIQSVDGFPSLVSDAWLNGRLTALHACSDIWATGGSVHSAQALITLPSVSSNLQKELLAHSLAGIKSVLSPQGAELLGGHTFESRSQPPSPISMGVEISLCVNGLVNKRIKSWSKNGLQPGDNLLISRSLGVGVIFAAAMEGKISPANFDAALDQINTSQHKLINSLIDLEKQEFRDRSINACTDITGFGLIGHLSEMIRSTNINRDKEGLKGVKVNLKVEDIPVLAGASDLFDLGFASTLAPENRNFLRIIGSENESEVQLTLDTIKFDSIQYRRMLELLVDPQTCGPLLISCSADFALKLLELGPWKRIGIVF